MLPLFPSATKVIARSKAAQAPEGRLGSLDLERSLGSRHDLGASDSTLQFEPPWVIAWGKGGLRGQRIQEGQIP